jgi:hypothetical protein
MFRQHRRRRAADVGFIGEIDGDELDRDIGLLRLLRDLDALFLVDVGADDGASSITVALPMPEAPPVTIATLPSNFIVPLLVSSMSMFRLNLRGMPGCVAASRHRTARVGWSLNRAYFALLIFVPFLP